VFVSILDTFERTADSDCKYSEARTVPASNPSGAVQLPEKADDLDRKMAICAGLELTVAETIELCGVVAPGTYYNRTKKTPLTFDEYRSFAAAAYAKRLSRVVQKAEAKASSAERVKKILDRALSQTERLLRLTEDTPDAEMTFKQLMDMHKSITVWSARYDISEAPRRVTVEGRLDVEHRMIGDEVVSRLSGFMNRNQALLPPSAEVITVESQPAQ
jgi:hypothetical protein